MSRARDTLAILAAIMSAAHGQIDPGSCICPGIFIPVCAGGETYSNACLASCANAEVEYEGECTDTSQAATLGQTIDTSTTRAPRTGTRTGTGTRPPQTGTGTGTRTRPANPTVDPSASRPTRTGTGTRPPRTGTGTGTRTRPANPTVDPTATRTPRVRPTRTRTQELGSGVSDDGEQDRCSRLRCSRDCRPYRTRPREQPPRQRRSDIVYRSAESIRRRWILLPHQRRQIIPETDGSGSLSGSGMGNRNTTDRIVQCGWDSSTNTCREGEETTRQEARALLEARQGACNAYTESPYIGLRDGALVFNAASTGSVFVNGENIISMISQAFADLEDGSGVAPSVPAQTTMSPGGRPPRIFRNASNIIVRHTGPILLNGINVLEDLARLQSMVEEVTSQELPSDPVPIRNRTSAFIGSRGPHLRIIASGTRGRVVFNGVDILRKLYNIRQVIAGLP